MQNIETYLGLNRIASAYSNMKDNMKYERFSEMY